MASSIVVISTQVGGIKYLLNENNAYLVKINDPQGMAKTIIEMLKNQETALDKTSNANHDALNYKWEYLKESGSKLLNKLSIFLPNHINEIMLF